MRPACRSTSSRGHRMGSQSGDRSFCGNGGQAKTRGGPEGGRGRPGVTSLGRCREPLVSGKRKAAGSVLALPDGDNLVDGEVSVLESEHAGCEVEQPRACAGWGDEPLSVLPGVAQVVHPGAQRQRVVLPQRLDVTHLETDLL